MRTKGILVLNSFHAWGGAKDTLERIQRERGNVTY